MLITEQKIQYAKFELDRAKDKLSKMNPQTDEYWEQIGIVQECQSAYNDARNYCTVANISMVA